MVVRGKTWSQSHAGGEGGKSNQRKQEARSISRLGQSLDTRGATGGGLAGRTSRGKKAR